ncbi:hypothetical protein M3Y96_00558800 [Aphelenchoides besseyi]|nr:hypothetical protein M3Y96_00558800 [Aphelenchoides besseyi]
MVLHLHLESAHFRKLVHKLLVSFRRRVHVNRQKAIENSKMTSYYEHGQQTNEHFQPEGAEFLVTEEDTTQEPTIEEAQLANGHENGAEGNGAEENGGVEQHFAYFRWAYDQANQSWYVQKAKDTYEATKKSFGPLERTLDGIESRVVDASQHAAPIYEHYVYPTTDRLAKACSKKLESSKGALELSKSIAVNGGNLGVGMAVIGTQLSLIASAALTSVLLDGMIMTKNLGSAAVQRGVQLEKSVEQGIYTAIESSRQLARNPVEKFNEHANGFLDVANALVDNFFKLPLDEETDQSADSNVKERIQRLARRLAHLVQTRTNENILESCQRQIQGLSEQLRKSLALVDVLRERREKLGGHVSGLNESMNEMWGKVEAEARELKQSPEEALINNIHRCSSTLNNYIGKLREKSVEVLPSAAVPRLESVANYVEQLHSNLGNAKTINDVKSEVLEEAKSKLQDVSNWTANLRSNGEKKDN